MVLPKSAVHVSRLAATALKTFTHGYAQTVVAASQSSYASQNTPVAPLASKFLTGFDNRTERPYTQHGSFHHVTSPAGHGAVGESGVQHSATLAQIRDVWKKHQKTAGSELVLKQATRISWASKARNDQVSEVTSQKTRRDSASAGESQGHDERRTLKRSYSTSAVETSTKPITTSETESRTLTVISDTDARIVGLAAATGELRPATNAELTSPVAALPAPSTVRDVSSTAGLYEAEMQRLLEEKDYLQIPVAFHAMVRDGLQQPSQNSYRALLMSATKLGSNPHHVTSRIFDICADMARRNVEPDAATSAMLIQTLSRRCLDDLESIDRLSQRRHRLGHDADLFKLDMMEYQMCAADPSVSLALQVYHGSKHQLPSVVLESLIVACAKSGYIAEMENLLVAHQERSSTIFPVVISAYARAGNLASAIATYESYRDLAIANNAGLSEVKRMDHEVYSALMTAYGACNELERGKRLLARIESSEADTKSITKSRGAILLTSILPAELQSGNFETVYGLVNTLTPEDYPIALALIARTTADAGNLAESRKAFDALVETGIDISSTAVAMYAMFLRVGQADAGERYWPMVENYTASCETLQLGVLRAINYLTTAQGPATLASVRQIMLHIAGERPRVLATAGLVAHAQEATKILVNAWCSVLPAAHDVASSAEVLRMMSLNHCWILPRVDTILSCTSASQINDLAAADLDIFIEAQARSLANGTQDTVGPCRFACMLESVIARSSTLSSSAVETIERTAASLQRDDLHELWKSYKYQQQQANLDHNASPSTQADEIWTLASTHSPGMSLASSDSFDPYAASTDHKGTIAITDLLEADQSSSKSVLNEAMLKLRDLRRAGRHPRFFAYSKLIQAAAKTGQLSIAQEILSVAQVDLPYSARYRIVRHGWTSILDAMVAACISNGRRDLAEVYHRQLLDMGSAPSANTFGLYMTSLKATTKTFDEASEAVKIFQRSKVEGVEPTSFLYNALIGKLGKARRIDDCLFFFAEMRKLDIKPTSVTYGTIVNALCRVSEGKFAEEMFEEMESCANYKPRPAPYHSIMQFFLSTKQDRKKVIEYYDRMRGWGIPPTAHTFKLLIDTYASIEPLAMAKAEGLLIQMDQAGLRPEAVHYASLIHAKGCAAHDLLGARQIFDRVTSDRSVLPQPCLYQAMIEAQVAHHQVSASEELVADMDKRGIQFTPYIANALIHGWTKERNIAKAGQAYNKVSVQAREPSTYEAMVRAYLASGDLAGARGVVDEALGRGYPSTVAAKIADLIPVGSHA